MEKQYVILPQYPHYRIYRSGRVVREEYTRVCFGKKILLPFKEIKQHVGRNGYPALCVRDTSDRVVKVYVHRLVWMAFNGEIPYGMEVSHKNSVRIDSRLENLCLESHKQNMNNPITLLRFKWSNSKKSGKYDKDRLATASTKQYEANAVKVYQMMSDGGKKPVKVMDYMAQAHIGFYRAKRIINEYAIN
jgi:hypothetical protein